MTKSTQLVTQQQLRARIRRLVTETAPFSPRPDPRVAVATARAVTRIRVACSFVRDLAQFSTDEAAVGTEALDIADAILDLLDCFEAAFGAPFSDYQ